MEAAVLAEQGAEPALVAAKQRAGEALARIPARADRDRTRRPGRVRRLGLPVGAPGPGTPAGFPAGRVGRLVAGEFRLLHADA